MSERPAKDGSLTARAGWFLVARALAFALSFGLPLLLVRRLSQSEFGLYKQVFLLAVTAVNLLPLGIEMSAYYFLPRESERRPYIILNILLFYVVMTGLAALALLLYPSVISKLFNSPELVGYAPSIALLMVLWGTPFILEVIATAHQEARLAAILIVGSELSKVVLLTLSAVFYGSVRSLIYAGIIHGAVQGLFLFVYLRSRFGRFWAGFDWGILRTQLGYSLPFGFAALLLRAQSDLHLYFVSNHFTPAMFATYAVGCFNMPLVGILGYAVGAVMIPRVSYLQKSSNKREILELLVRMMRKLAAAYFPIYVFLLLMGREFIELLFTRQYLASWPIFAVNLTVIPLGILTTANDAVMRAHAEQKYFLIRVRTALIALLFLGLVVATNKFGLLGAISVVVCTAFLEVVITGSRVARIVGLTVRDLVLLRDLLKLAVVSVGAGLVAMLARTLILPARPFIALAICGAVFFTIYIAGLFLFDVVTTDERRLISQKILAFNRLAGWRRAADTVGGGS